MHYTTFDGRFVSKHQLLSITEAEGKEWIKLLFAFAKECFKYIRFYCKSDLFYITLKVMRRLAHILPIFIKPANKIALKSFVLEVMTLPDIEKECEKAKDKIVDFERYLFA